jgi:hypothetical protein
MFLKKKLKKFSSLKHHVIMELRRWGKLFSPKNEKKFAKE